MIIAVFGNPILESDSLPLRIMPELQKTFPKIEFRVLDPNEDWEIPENLIIIDTVVGINAITTFDSLDQFSAAPTLSLHDFDAYANLRLLQKLGKLKKVVIIGVPQNANENQTLKKIIPILTGISPS